MISARAILVATLLALPTLAHAQRGRAAGPPQSPREAAAIDLTGYWVSVVFEDWKYRMVTPRKGVFDTLALNAEGRRVGEQWDPARDEAAGEQCRAYGAANVMRLPGRIHVTWQDASTLRIETDAGTQTRLFRFPSTGSGQADATPAGEASWQGQSTARWVYGPPARGSATRSGSLKVITTNLRPGYVRRNGAPYSEKATVTEYYDLNTAPNGDQWMTVTTRVDDPVYFRAPYITSTDFKKLPDAAGWNPTACTAR